jgi:hypothetical protein
MKNLLHITPLLFLLFFTSSMKTDNTFPHLECTDLHSKEVVLPTDIKGKYSILVLAASQKAESDLQSWMLPLFNDFIADNSKNMFAREVYDVNTYFVPVFSGVAKATANNIKKKMLRGLDPLLQSHVLIYKGSANKLFQTLDLNKKQAVLLILTKKGAIVQKISGGYTEEKMEQITEAIAK